jgi:hypothetical protein
MGREPPGLSFEKSKGDPIGLMCDDARRCVRIRFFWLAIRRKIMKILVVTAREIAFVNRSSDPSLATCSARARDVELAESPGTDHVEYGVHFQFGHSRSGANHADLFKLCEDWRSDLPVTPTRIGRSAVLNACRPVGVAS